MSFSVETMYAAACLVLKEMKHTALPPPHYRCTMCAAAARSQLNCGTVGRKEIGFRTHLDYTSNLHKLINQIVFFPKHVKKGASHGTFCHGDSAPSSKILLTFFIRTWQGNVKKNESVHKFVFSVPLCRTTEQHHNRGSQYPQGSHLCQGSPPHLAQWASHLLP